MNQPREYKNSIFYTLLVIVVVGISIFTLLAVIGIQQAGFIMLPMAAMFFVFSVGLLYMASSKTVVSEDEISSKTLFGTKTLKWSEIASVSGSGYAIKLHNSDGDMTVAFSPRMPGYQEIVELIGVKRPDLFNPQDYIKISRSLMGWVGVLAWSFSGLLFSVLGIFSYMISETKDMKDLAITIACVVLGLGFMGIYLFAPWFVTIQGRSITIGYLFTRKTFTAEEILSINLGYSQTRRGGRNYYVLITKKGQTGIQISGIKPSVPIAYLALKNWHKQNINLRITQ